MKKFLFISIAFFYLVLSTGVNVHAHYCMGNLVDLKTPWDSNEHSCSTSENHNKKSFSCCTGKDKPDCCDETLIQVKLDIPALGNSTQNIDFKLVSILLPFKTIDFSFSPKALFDFDFEFYRPPPILKDIRIITQSLLFYH